MNAMACESVRAAVILPHVESIWLVDWLPGSIDHMNCVSMNKQAGTALTRNNRGHGHPTFVVIMTFLILKEVS